MVKKIEQIEVGYCDTCGEKSYDSCSMCGVDICPDHVHCINIEAGSNDILHAWDARPKRLWYKVCGNCEPEFWKAIAALKRIEMED